MENGGKKIHKTFGKIQNQIHRIFDDEKFSIVENGFSLISFGMIFLSTNIQTFTENYKINNSIDFETTKFNRIIIIIILRQD